MKIQNRLEDSATETTEIITSPKSQEIEDSPKDDLPIDGATKAGASTKTEELEVEAKVESSVIEKKDAKKKT